MLKLPSTVAVLLLPLVALASLLSPVTVAVLSSPEVASASLLLPVTVAVLLLPLSRRTLRCCRR